MYDVHLRKLNKTIEFRRSVLSTFTSRGKLYSLKGRTKIMSSCLVVSSRLKKVPYKARTKIVTSRLAVAGCSYEKCVG